MDRALASSRRTAHQHAGEVGGAPGSRRPAAERRQIKRFEPKLKCYALCPEVNDDGEYRENSARWEDC